MFFWYVKFAMILICNEMIIFPKFIFCLNPHLSLSHLGGISKKLSSRLKNFDRQECEGAWFNTLTNEHP